MQDNQTFVLDYIQEVKPYHVQVRQFNLIYSGLNTYFGSLTDFDVPAYWDINLTVPQFVSPVLTPYDKSNSLVENFVSDAAPNTEIWTLDPWKEWFNNYLLSIQEINITRSGAGYTVEPQVVVNGVVDSNFVATINSAGQVVAVDILVNSETYSSTPEITFVGGNGVGAQAVAVMGNNLVRSIKTVIKYDRCEYYSTVTDWTANISYSVGALVRYAGQVWAANTNNTSALFNPADWNIVDSATLNGADRTMGYYTPTANEPGRQWSLLVDGIDYPGVQVSGPLFSQSTGYDVGNFDINPFDNISYDANGSPTYDPAILDARYASFYGPPPVPPYPPTDTDVNVDGGAYVDTYSSHAPEELIPGAEFDTLDLRVYTTPGSDWSGLGHGFPMKSISYVYDSMNPTYSFAGLLEFPMVVIAFNITTGIALEADSYNWVDYELTISYGVNDGDIINILVFATGGGNQLMSDTYIGSNIGDTIIIPFPATAISNFVIYNGEIPLYNSIDYTYTANNEFSTAITFTTTYGATDRINLTALGYAASGTTHSWSLPVFDTILIEDSSILTYTLHNSLQGTNPVNLIVLRNGVRARPYEGVQYIGNNIETTFTLPYSGGYLESSVADSDVSVYIDGTLLALGSDYVVNAYDGSTIRTVTLAQPAPLGSKVLISVSTDAQYVVQGNQLTFLPSAGLSPQVGDIIEVVTWNDTSEQNIVTHVFVGPRTQGITITQGYDITLYDEATINNTSGSFDYSTGTVITTNTFDLGTVITDPQRLFVTLNGNYLTSGQGYTVSGTTVIINGPVIGANDTLVVTTFTQQVVPAAMAFRIFQNMRGEQTTYRITPGTTTTLVQPLGQTDDIIYLSDANAVGEPNLADNIWGVITINGERIMYRIRDVITNTVSSLLRGTGGTAASAHNNGSTVYDLGIGNLMPVEYQNYVVSNSTLADGSTTTFDAVDINIANEDSTIRNETVEVYVGGILQTSGYTITSIDTVTIEFAVAPASGSEVTILVRRGVTWYNPGVNTPSNGVPLQETNNPAARFLQGR